jgi:hypothetical protein
MKDGYRTDIPYDKKYVMAREMYDYEKDPLEKVSVVDMPEYRQDQQNMEKLFVESMQREYKSSIGYSKIADFRTPVLVGTEAKKAKKVKGNSKE